MGDLIKWTGSKSYLANEIISYFPNNFKTYYEPFLGGGSILLTLKAPNSIANDKDSNLISLWKEIKNNYISLIEEYRKHYKRLKKGKDYYYKIRERFNKNNNPSDFFFLIRTCHNGLIRYSEEGKFNTALHLGRDGMQPEKVRKLILKHLPQIKRTTFLNMDYIDLLKKVDDKDFIFFDPPYKEMKDGTIYNEKFNHFLFYQSLRDLNKREIRWALTYGKTPIPQDLYVYRTALERSNSSFSRLKRKRSIIQESLYLNFSPKYKKTKITNFLG